MGTTPVLLIGCDFSARLALESQDHMQRPLQVCLGWSRLTDDALLHYQADRGEPQILPFLYLWPY